MKKLNHNGFTLIELMIASLVFSVILLGATTATIQIGRMYYKGIIMNRTQETARRLMDDISRPIQFAGSTPRDVDPTPISGIPTGALCIGDQRFTYGINAQVDDNAPIGSYNNHKARHGVWQDTLNSSTSPCTPLDLTQAIPQDGNTNTNRPRREVLSKNMRLGRFTVSSSGNLWTIDALVIYGDDDLLIPDANNPAACANLSQSAQWCATSALSTTVYKRINPEFN
jgi:prepilin-type N-terminal cleavage/methylation domain-containing protein